jgi:hypothetical protein
MNRYISAWSGSPDEIGLFWCCPPDPVAAPVTFLDLSGGIYRPNEFDVSVPMDEVSGIGAPIQTTWFGIRGRDTR